MYADSVAVEVCLGAKFVVLVLLLDSCTGMGITVFPRLFRGNGDRVHGNTAGMGTNFTVVPRGRGPSSR